MRLQNKSERYSQNDEPTCFFIFPYFPGRINTKECKKRHYVRVLEIDATNPSTFANQLFAVCELIPTSKCDPTHNPKAQIANFGWSKVDDSWPLDGVIIYKLVHTQ